MANQSIPPIVVVGAGITGIATALNLQRQVRGKGSVILIDRKGPGAGASFGNAGVLSPTAVVPVPTLTMAQPGFIWKAPGMVLDPMQPLFLKWGYMPRFLPWLLRYFHYGNQAHVLRIVKALHPLVHNAVAEHQALAKGTKAARFISPSHYTYVYRDRAHYAGDHLGWKIRTELGYGCKEYEGAALAKYEPILVGSAYGFAAGMPKHGLVLSPGDYVAALAAGFEAAGGRYIKAAVKNIAWQGGKVAGVMLAGKTSNTTELLPAQQVIMTTGVWTRDLLKPFGVRIPLEAESGYHIDLWQPSQTPKTPLAFVSMGKLVFAPMENRLRIAGVVEFGGIRDKPSSAPLRMILRYVRAMLPNLRWAEKTEWMGHRPLLADSIPIISPVPKADGLYVASGHHHMGMTAGAKTGRIMAEMVLADRGGKPAAKPADMDMTPYDIGRFME